MADRLSIQDAASRILQMSMPLSQPDEKTDQLSKRLFVDRNRPLHEVPFSPPDGSLDANVLEAKKHVDEPLPAKLWWFYNRVKSGGPWDYKREHANTPELAKEFEDFGNYNYGRTGAAAGIPDWLLKRAAGAAQFAGGHSKPSYGNPFGSAPYGDDPWDQISDRPRNLGGAPLGALSLRLGWA